MLKLIRIQINYYLANNVVLFGLRESYFLHPHVPPREIIQSDSNQQVQLCIRAIAQL